MIGRCYVLINDRRAGSRWSAGRQLNSPDVLAESSPFLRRLVISIFKLVRKIHRPVTLHGDTAGSRGVCSLLLDSSRKTRTRIYGRLIEAVSSWSLINPHLFSIDWFPSLNSGGLSIEWSLFMETQLGPGESALCCWTLLENKKQDSCKFHRSCTYIITRAVKFWSVGWLVNRNALVGPNSLWSDYGWCSFNKNKELLNPLF